MYALCMMIDIKSVKMLCSKLITTDVKTCYFGCNIIQNDRPTVSIGSSAKLYKNVLIHELNGQI